MPSFTMKWLFSQFKDKLCLPRFQHFFQMDRHVEKESRRPKKSSIKYFHRFFNQSGRLPSIHRWKRARSITLAQKDATIGESSVMAQVKGLSFLDLLGQVGSVNNREAMRKSKYWFPASLSSIWSMKGNGKWSFRVASLSFL
ncbi:hypothetical protein Tco_1354040 [Tanacetum coccineum]